MTLIARRLPTFQIGVGAPPARVLMARRGGHVGVLVSRAKLSRSLKRFGWLLSILLLGCIASRTSLAQSSITLFSSEVPANPVEADPNAVTLGVKFWSTQPGDVSGIRFYRGRSNSGGYTVRLYTAGGSILAQGTAPNDTCAVPCWEQVNFATPISISVNTTYIATYYSSNGYYTDGYYGLTNGATNGPLVVPASGVSGGNGIYVYGKGFPTSTWEDSNYYVDIVFTPSAPSLTLSFSPPNPIIPANVSPGTVVATITATWSNGAPFTGTLGFGAPNSTYSNDNGTFAISGNDLVVSSDAGVSSYANTIQNVTIVAIQ